VKVNGQRRKGRTRYADTINIFWNDSATFDYFIELGTTAMEDDRIQADAVEKTETQSEFIELPQYSTADFDNSELCWVRRIRGRGEYAKVALDLAFCSNGV